MPDALDLTAAALLFDMDGTLVDSTAVVERVWSEFAEAFDLDPGEVIRFAHGRLTADTVAHFVADPDSAARASAGIDADELVRLDGIVEVPGARALLGALSGLPHAVVTSASRELATRRMGAAGVPVPDVMVSAEEVREGKPAPEGYLRAAALLGVPAGDCVVFEDAEAGVRAGLAAGARVVVVGSLRSPVAEGLPRLPDLRGARVTADPEGIRLRRP